MPPQTPKADLHTPDELMLRAVELLETNDPRLRRAVVIEAMTALEAYVAATVFPLLAAKVGDPLSKLIEAKTRMDFETRLSVLAPAAMGITVDRGSAHWQDFKRIRKLRHGIVHAGKQVSASDAREAVASIRRWLAFLGSTVGIELSLQEFKRVFEASGRRIQRGSDAVQAIKAFFAGPLVAVFTEPVTRLTGQKRRLRPDLVLDFGSQRVAIEVKVTGQRAVSSVVHAVEMDLARALADSGVDRTALVIFNTGSRDKQLVVESLKMRDPQLLVLVINA